MGLSAIYNLRWKKIRGYLCRGGVRIGRDDGKMNIKRFFSAGFILSIWFALAACSRAAPLFPAREPSSRIIFQSNRGGVQSGYVMNPDGSGQMRLAQVGDRSADGQRIVFSSISNDANLHDQNSEIYVKNSDGSGLMLLTDHPASDISPAWSPDGRRVVFVSNRDDEDFAGCDIRHCNWEIYVVDADGKNLFRLTDHPAQDISPSWSPDGNRIAFISNRDMAQENKQGIYLVGSDGSNLRLLVSEFLFLSPPAWSPGGGKIAFASFGNGSSGAENNAEIHAINVNGTKRSRLTRSPGLDGFPAWSPDGTQIAFSSYRDEPDFQNCGDDCNSEIYVMNADGSDTIRLTDEPGEDSFPDWLPDSAVLSYEDLWMPGDFLRNGMAAILCMGIMICLQKSYLNRIHTALGTGHSLSDYFNAGHFREKGILGLIRDAYYTFSKLFILTALIEAVSLLALSITSYPGYLAKTPPNLYLSLALGILTIALGHGYMEKREYIRIGMIQRIWSGVTFGLLLAITLQFLSRVPLQGMAAAVLGVLLLGFQLAVILAIPKKITADEPAAWILDMAGMIPGSLAGWGLMEALKSGWISLSSLTAFDQYFALLVSILLAGLSFVIWREMSRVSDQFLSPSRSRRSKVRTFMVLLANNILLFLPFYLGALALPLTITKSMPVIQTPDYPRIALVSTIILLVFLILYKTAPKFLHSLIEIIGNRGVSTDYSTDEPGRHINPVTTYNVSRLDEERTRQIEQDTAEIENASPISMEISEEDAAEFWRTVASNAENIQQQQERSSRKNSRGKKTRKPKSKQNG